MIGFILIHLRTEGVGGTVIIRLILTKEMRERLRHERIHHPHPRVRQRLEALYLKSEG